MLYYCQTNNKKDLASIIDLARKNQFVRDRLGHNEQEGFVSVPYDLKTLISISSLHKQPVIKNEKYGKVIAYAIMLDPLSRDQIPFLHGFFNQLDQLHYNDLRLADLSYLVMGQICIDVGYRSKGLFRKLYDYFIEKSPNSCEYIITEISVINKRSLIAHKSIGFEELHEFTSEDGSAWRIVILPIRPRAGIKL